VVVAGAVVDVAAVIVEAAVVVDPVLCSRASRLSMRQLRG